MTTSKRAKRHRAKPKTKGKRRSTRRTPSSLFTRRELAALLDVHMMTVTKWEHEGLPVAVRGRKGKPSKYREVDVRAWLQQREEAAKAGPGVDVARERARKELAQAILAEQTHAMRARNLLPRDEVERVWNAEVSAVRAKLLAWPATLADKIHRVSTLEGLAGVERTLEEAVREVLRELSDPDRAPTERDLAAMPSAPLAP